MKTFKDGEKNQQVAGGKSWFSWTNDGPNANINSLQVLLDWISTPGNYNRFTGGAGQKGETKLTVAVEIQNNIQKAGIVVNRSTDSIIHKIKELVTTYKEAHRVKNQTGESMEAVYAACKYYDILDPILGSRPSVKPLLTNKQIVNGKIVAESNVGRNPSSPASMTGSEDSIASLKSTTITSSRASTSTSLAAKISASASAKKNVDTTVAKGKDRSRRGSDKV
jgi:hypothetical protein